MSAAGGRHALWLAALLAAAAVSLQATDEIPQVVARPPHPPVQQLYPTGSEKALGSQPWRATFRTNLSIRTAAILVGGQDGGDVPLAILCLPVETSEDRSVALLVIDVDARLLLADAAARSNGVELAIYGLGAGGSVVGSMIANLAPPAAVTADGSSGSIKLLTAVEAIAEMQSIRVLVRSSTGAFGLRSVTPGVPDRSASTTGGLLVADDSQYWPTTLLTGNWPTLATFSPTGALLPAARPVLRVGTPTDIAWLARSVPALAPRFGLQVRRGPSTVAELEVHVRERAETAWPGLERIIGELTLPALPPGQYTLTALERGDAGAPMSRPLPIVVAGTASAAGTATALITDAQKAPAEDDLSNPFEVDLSVEPTRGVGDGFHDALREGTNKGASGLREAIAKYERATLVRGAAREFRQLATSELATVQWLARNDPRAVLALALLHLELYQSYKATKSYLHMAHTHQLLLRLIPVLAEHEDKGGGHALAADLAVVVAATLEENGMASGADDFFALALKLAPAHPAALVGVAAYAEQRGAYGRAAEALIRLLAVHPDNLEARLRLAINLSRIGQDRRANELLLASQTPVNPSWIRSLAFQQQIVVLRKAGKLERAQEVVTRAREALPNDFQLGILEIQLAEQRGQRARARQLAAALLKASAQGESARYQYTLLATHDLVEPRTRIKELGPGAFAALENVLTKSPSGGK